MKRLLLAVGVVLVAGGGVPLTLSVVIGRLSGASWTACLHGFLTWLKVASLYLGIGGILYAVVWISGAVAFAISNGYRLKDFLKK